jgi:16S rRNA (cytosine967-C5)-methyltransferase
MTPSARVQSAIEILDLIITAARENGPAADTIVSNWFKTRRFAGSKDRRAVRDLVYSAIRAFGMMPKTGRMAMVGLANHDKALAALFDGSLYGPAVIERSEQRVALSPLAPWLGQLLDPAEHAALLERAPLDLRVNSLQAKREDVLAQFEGAEAIQFTRDGIRLPENIVVENHPAWREGLIEVQDAGSQVIAAVCDVKQGMTVIDLCAGAGGKTLALAAAMGGANDEASRLIATDTNRDRIQRLVPRAARAGAVDIETRLLDPDKEMEALGDLVGVADLVLVDAPCSGSGTWRRNPEARWRLTPARLDAVTKVQSHVLELGARLVKPGGALVYAVCSLIQVEGLKQIERFLRAHPDWQAVSPDLPVGRSNGAGWMLTPGRDGCDGFFIARLQRI